MKNDEQMYQSVLSRRDAYRAKKERRIRTGRRTVPVLACCCLAAVLGLGYRNHLKKLPEIPAAPESSDIAVTVPPVTTAPLSVSETAVRRTEAVTTAAQTEITRTASETNTQTVTVPEADAAASAAVRQTETQAAVTAPSVTQTQTATKTKPVTEPHAATTEEPAAPEPPANTTETNPQPQSPSKEDPNAQQAQPLIYPDIQAAADAVKAGDLSAYALWEKYQYRAMFDRMLIDGFLYQVSNANGNTQQDDRGIALLPDAAYEDIGVSCRVLYQGQSYYVAFHYADYYADYSHLTMPEYLQKRMKCASDKDVTVNGEAVCLRFADNGQITANAFAERDNDRKWNPDSEVYYTVRASVSETEMLDFLHAMQYEKIPLR